MDAGLRRRDQDQRRAIGGERGWWADLEGVARLAAHELEGALQHGARVPERPAAPAVGDGNVEQLGRRGGRRVRHGWVGQGRAEQQAAWSSGARGRLTSEPDQQRWGF